MTLCFTTIRLLSKSRLLHNLLLFSQWTLYTFRQLRKWFSNCCVTNIVCPWNAPQSKKVGTEISKRTPVGSNQLERFTYVVGFGFRELSGFYSTICSARNKFLNWWRNSHQYFFLTTIRCWKLFIFQIDSILLCVCREMGFKWQSGTRHSWRPRTIPWNDHKLHSIF